MLAGVPGSGFYVAVSFPHLVSADPAPLVRVVELGAGIHADDEVVSGRGRSLSISDSRLTPYSQRCPAPEIDDSSRMPIGLAILGQHKTPLHGDSAGSDLVEARVPIRRTTRLRIVSEYAGSIAKRHRGTSLEFVLARSRGVLP